MIELERNSYGMVKKFVDIITCDKVYPLSILEGRQVGRVFVDSVKNINSALFWHYCGFSYLTGNPSEAFLNDISLLIKQEYEPNQRRCVLHINNDDLDNYFSNVSGIIRAEQYRFLFKQDKSDECSLLLKNGYEIRELDEKILSKLDGRIIPSFSWGSTDDFLEKGKGYCILDENEVVTVAFTAAISDTEVDIGIETNEKYRKQGFGKCVAALMVKDVLKRNKTPIWECNINNLGSKAIAESVGFEVLETYPLFYKNI